MPFTKKIVCLANSRKLSGFCVAGKELIYNEIGEWIRPVSNRPLEELSPKEIRYKYWKKPKLLDIINIPLIEHSPNSYQTENYLIDDRQKWVKIGALKKTDLEKLCDNVDSLWINGYSSQKGKNDKIPQEITEKNIFSSLLFIKPESFSIIVGYKNINYNKSKRVWADFIFKKINYRLTITDPVIEKKFLRKKNKTYYIDKNDLFFCISLGRPFYGFNYKLVAALLNLK